MSGDRTAGQSAMCERLNRKRQHMKGVIGSLELLRDASQFGALCDDDRGGELEVILYR